MGLFRRMPVVRSAVRHGSQIKGQLATIEQRTAEFQPGVVATLLYDSASALEALEHIVLDMREQDDSIDALHVDVRSLHEVLQVTRDTLVSLVHATSQQILQGQNAQPLTVDEFRVGLSTTQQRIDQVLRAVNQAPVAPSEQPYIDRLETLITQILNRVDRIALESKSASERTLAQWTDVLDQTNSSKHSVLEQLGEMSQSHDLLMNEIATLEERLVTTSDRLRSSLRFDINEDLSAAVELVAKELGRIDEAVSESLSTRSDSISNEWMRLEMSLRNELSGDIQRSETRVLKDLSHARELLSAELAARTTQIGSDLSRSELSIRDDIARRVSDLSRSGDDHGQQLNAAMELLRSGQESLRSGRAMDPEMLKALQESLAATAERLTAAQALHEHRMADVVAQVVAETVTGVGETLTGAVTGAVSAIPAPESVEPLRTTLESAIGQFKAAATPTAPTTAAPQVLEALADIQGRLSGPQRGPDVRANPIEPEVALASALVPHLEGDYGIDVGSHRGLWAAALSAQGLRVLALEPNPKLAEALKQRFHEGSRVEVVKAAATNEVGSAMLRTVEDVSHGKLFGDTSLFSTLRSSTPQTEGLQFVDGPTVAATTLATLASDFGFTNRLAIVKIDTEGTEHEVLDGLGLLRPEVLVVEFWGKGYLLNGPEPTHPEAMVERMIERGYRRWIGFIHMGDTLQARTNPRTFPDDCWGNFFFFNDRETFAVAQRWCDQSLVGGCR